MAKAAPRDVFGKVLLEMGEKNPRLFVVNPDVADATKTKSFGEKFKDRYINVGICEQNAIGITAGLARAGFIPIVSGFASFIPGRCYDEIRQSIAYSNLNVKIISTHPGLSIGMDGAMHQSLDDIALMREIPNFVVLAPSDQYETRKAILKAVEYEGPVYIRVGRMECEDIYDDNFNFCIGKSQVIEDGKDITLMAHGIMVNAIKNAAAELKNIGIACRVIDMYSIKPVDEEQIIKAAEETRRIITVEDHWIYGGLFSTVSEITSKKCPCHVDGIAVMDKFGQSGSAGELFEEYHLTIKDIISRAINLLILNC